MKKKSHFGKRSSSYIKYPIIMIKKIPVKFFLQDILKNIFGIPKILIYTSVYTEFSVLKVL